MRTRSEYLIQKRDGRLQGLRATKLARSMQRALAGGSGVPVVGGPVVGGPVVGGPDAEDSSFGEGTGGDGVAADLLAFELAEAILRAVGAVRPRVPGAGKPGQPAIPRAGGSGFRISAAQLAEVAVGALRQSGHREAAERFLAYRARQVAFRRSRVGLRAERVVLALTLPETGSPRLAGSLGSSGTLPPSGPPSGSQWPFDGPAHRPR